VEEGQDRRRRQGRSLILSNLQKIAAPKGAAFFYWIVLIYKNTKYVLKTVMLSGMITETVLNCRNQGVFCAQQGEKT
jgi:hypothetical protein